MLRLTSEEWENLKCQIGISTFPSTSANVKKFWVIQPQIVAAASTVDVAAYLTPLSRKASAMLMILDRDTDAISAAITSLQVVLSNLAVMLLGGMLTLLVGAALLPWDLGLLLVGP
jgi:uncharacterized membrane protein